MPGARTCPVGGVSPPVPVLAAHLLELLRHPAHTLLRHLRSRHRVVCSLSLFSICYYPQTGVIVPYRTVDRWLDEHCMISAMHLGRMLFMLICSIGSARISPRVWPRRQALPSLASRVQGPSPEQVEGIRRETLVCQAQRIRRRHWGWRAAISPRLQRQYSI